MPNESGEKPWWEDDPFYCKHGTYIGPSDINGINFYCPECRAEERGGETSSSGDLGCGCAMAIVVIAIIALYYILN